MKMATIPPHTPLRCSAGKCECTSEGAKLQKSHRRVSVFAKPGLFAPYYVCWVCLFVFYDLFVFVCSSHCLGWMLLSVVLFYEWILCAAIYRIRASYSLQARQALWECLSVFAVRQRQTHRQPLRLWRKIFNNQLCLVCDLDSIAWKPKLLYYWYWFAVHSFVK